MSRIWPFVAAAMSVQLIFIAACLIAGGATTEGYAAIGLTVVVIAVCHLAEVARARGTFA